jgi:hypothetical protein
MSISETPQLPLDASPPEPPHHGLASRVRTYFLTGLVVAGPVAITM